MDFDEFSILSTRFITNVVTQNLGYLLYIGGSYQGFGAQLVINPVYIGDYSTLGMKSYPARDYVIRHEIRIPEPEPISTNAMP